MSNHYWAYYILLKKTWSWNIQTLCTTLLCDFFNGTCDGYFQAKNSQLINKKAETRFIWQNYLVQKTVCQVRNCYDVILYLLHHCLLISVFLLMSQIFYLNEYMEFENEIIMISTYFQKIFVKYFIIFLFQFLASIYVYRLLFSWDQ